MTSELFEEWLKKFDLKMRSEGRHILLMIDNFSGHRVLYEPTNIQMEFFEPNLTSFVQPLDAGIIRCFKAHYHASFCQRALLLDEAGERDIFKITLKEAMMLTDEAWKAVTAETIQHCCNHTQIQPATISNNATPLPPHSDYGAWEILRQFASSDMTLPKAEAKLSSHLGDRYNDANWRPALKAVMDSEGDVLKAQKAIQALSAACEHPRLTIKIPAMHPPQLVVTEKELILPTAEELTNSEREHKISDGSPYAFPGGDLEIVKQVKYETKVQCGEIIEVEDEEEEVEEPDAGVTRHDTIALITQLEHLSIKFGGGDMNTTGLTQQLRNRLYLVKWSGYLDSENQWVNKADIFAKDKIREYEQSNSAPKTYLRTSRSAESPHPPSLPILLTPHHPKYMDASYYASKTAEEVFLAELLEGLISLPEARQRLRRVHETGDTSALGYDAGYDINDSDNDDHSTGEEPSPYQYDTAFKPTVKRPAELWWYTAQTWTQEQLDTASAERREKLLQRRAELKRLRESRLQASG
ncbi:DDE superfamily endonuclease-domain-containing protein [Lactarius psammicola]|nr:DDE superfamily endonuclease-domain-containing protein [Lactarius psammicola]